MATITITAVSIKPSSVASTSGEIPAGLMDAILSRRFPNRLPYCGHIGAWAWERDAAKKVARRLISFKNS